MSDALRRIRNLVAAISAAPDAGAPLDMWLSVLAIPQGRQSWFLETFAGLQAEVTAVGDRCVGAPEDCAFVCAKLAELVSFEALKRPWKETRALASFELGERIERLTVGTEDRTQLSDEDLGDLEEHVGALRRSTQGAELSPHAKAFIEGNLRLMEKALFQHRWLGDQALTVPFFDALVLKGQLPGETTLPAGVIEQIQAFWGRASKVLKRALVAAGVSLPVLLSAGDDALGIAEKSLGLAERQSQVSEEVDGQRDHDSAVPDALETAADEGF